MQKQQLRINNTGRTIPSNMSDNRYKHVQYIDICFLCSPAN